MPVPTPIRSKRRALPPTRTDDAWPGSTCTLPELELYRPDVAEPDDFDEFWQRTLDEARAFPAEPVVERVASPLTQVEVHDVTFNGFAGQPVKAWLLLPSGSGRRRAAARRHRVPRLRRRTRPAAREARVGGIRLRASHHGHPRPGQRLGHRRRHPRPRRAPGPSSPGFMTRGIQSPDDYYYRRVYTDAVRLVDAARTLPQIDPRASPSPA